MTNQELERYALFLKTHRLTRFEIEENGSRLVLEDQPPVCPSTPLASPTGVGFAPSFDTNQSLNPSSESAHENNSQPENLLVRAPLIGIACRAKDSSSRPFVEMGQRVSKGDVLCLIEAMKMYNEVVAPADGIIAGIHFENGILVEYGAQLFDIS